MASSPPTDPERGFRRVVTGHDAHGRSYCASDDRTTEQLGWLYNLWITPPGPADNATPGDTVPPSGRTPLAVPPGGSLFRICRVPPKTFVESLTDQEIRDIFVSLGAEHARRPVAGHPLMHTTETLDYIVMLEGQVTLHLDAGDVHLQPFDTVIQRGTSHGWSNPTDRWAVFAIAMVGAEPLYRRGHERHD